MKIKNEISGIVAILLFAMAFIGQGCTREEDPQPASTLSFSIEYAVDSQPLLFDTLLYQNDAGNLYSVYRLEYFLTQISLLKSDGSEERIRDCQYINAADEATNHFSISSVPEGNYTGIRFNIGVDAGHNFTGGLSNSMQNNNMEWPALMGGGYHFMKFEGHFTEQDTLYGFAMHMGKNENLVKVEILSPLSFKHQEINYILEMNLNEWFRNPAVYDFDMDGNYSMSDSLAMHKLMANGTDVFTRRLQP